MRPPGIPASATIWAEVVDGLGRKVGAWFVPPFMKGDLGHVDMYDPEQPSAPWAWSSRCDSQWKGSFDERLTPSAAAQCRQLYERGMKEQEKTDRAARLAAQANGLCGECKTRRYDPKSNIAMCTECLAAVDFPGPEWRQEIREEAKDLAETKPRPPCIPSHIADTDWTVIEGRAAWRELGQLHGDFSDGSYIGEDWFKKARAWGGFEPKPTLTPVDLTELREAWKVWLGSHNSHDWLRFSNAIEKLLSSGGAP